MIRKLIDALKSGKYSQAIGRLRSGECFCAEGVACDVFAKETGKGEWDGNDFVYDGNKYSLAMPGAVARYFGISPFNCELQVMNDVRGLSLPEIGERLEQR